MGAFESGQAFLAGVLAKLPSEQRAQAEALFNAAEAKDAVTILGDGALARSDYSRSMDTLREKEQALTEYYTRLNGWYADNQAALDRVRALETEGTAAAGATGAAAAAGAAAAGAAAAAGLSAADIRRIADEAINEAGRDYIAVNSFMIEQADKHKALFGEPLPMSEITGNPKLGRPIAGQPGRIFSLDDAYREKYGERLVAKHKELEDKRINDEVEKRLLERTRASATHPFPLRQESSPLDALQTKDGPATHTLDSAVAEYERLQATRGA